MDPLQTLLDWAEALGYPDFSKAAALLNCYYQWRLKGGFEPRTLTDKLGDVVANDLGNQLAGARGKVAPIDNDNAENALLDCLEAVRLKRYFQALGRLNSYYQLRLKFAPVDGRTDDVHLADRLGNQLADALEKAE